jgi:hypothetical protein
LRIVTRLRIEGPQRIFRSFHPAPDVPVAETTQYVPTREGKRIWALVAKLDTSSPDKDSRRLGALTRLSARADELHREAAKTHQLQAASYRVSQ